MLRERLGHDIHGERWANRIKETLMENGLKTSNSHYKCQYAQCNEFLVCAKSFIKIVQEQIKIGNI